MFSVNSKQHGRGKFSRTPWEEHDPSWGVSSSEPGGETNTEAWSVSFGHGPLEIVLRQGCPRGKVFERWAQLKSLFKVLALELRDRVEPKVLVATTLPSWVSTIKKTPTAQWRMFSARSPNTSFTICAANAQLLANQARRAEFISFVHRLEQRAVASQAETKMSQPDKVSPSSPTPNQY